MADTVVHVLYGASARGARYLRFAWSRPGRPTLVTTGQLLIDVPAAGAVPRPASFGYNARREYHFPRNDAAFAYNEPFADPDNTYTAVAHSYPVCNLGPGWPLSLCPSGFRRSSPTTARP